MQPRAKTGPIVTKKISQLAVLGVAVLISALGVSSPAEAQCTPFPKIALWSELTHDFVRQQVEDRYDGDWDAYLVKLKNIQGKLKSIHALGLRAGVTWRDKKVRLKGRELAAFLKLLEQRLRVTECLAENDAMADFETAASGDAIADFSTAAGGDAFEAKEAKADSGNQVQCGTIPNLAWWELKTHEVIVDYVSRKHFDDWRPYIAKWSRKLGRLQDIYNRGGTATTNTGIRLRGSELKTYLEQMRTRVSVIRCLATANPDSKA